MLKVLTPLIDRRIDKKHIQSQWSRTESQKSTLASGKSRDKRETIFEKHLAVFEPLRNTIIRPFIRLFVA